MTREECFIKWMDENETWLEEHNVRARDAKEIFYDGWNAYINVNPQVSQNPPKPKAPEQGVPYAEIISIMNSVLGTSYRNTEATKTFIHARWKEGFRESDFKRVCEIKKKQWGNDPSWSIYLRPQTLFSNKMESYLQEKHDTCTTPDWM